ARVYVIHAWSGNRVASPGLGLCLGRADIHASDQKAADGHAQLAVAQVELVADRFVVNHARGAAAEPPLERREQLRRLDNVRSSGDTQPAHARQCSTLSRAQARPGVTSPVSYANTTSSPRSRASGLAITPLTWVLAVEVVITSCSAI